jgi:Fic family protein
MPEAFSVRDFVIQSNLIDVQPGYPGRVEGEPLFENHMRAWEFASGRAKDNHYNTVLFRNDNYILDIHRQLTWGVEYMENRHESGMYRRTAVTVASYEGVRPYLVPTAMERWRNALREVIYSLTQDERTSFHMEMMTHAELVSLAWNFHHWFEVIHPFADGNGRTGRILLNIIRSYFSLDPIVIYHSHVQEYYDAINEWREANKRTRLTEFSLIHLDPPLYHTLAELRKGNQ